MKNSLKTESGGFEKKSSSIITPRTRAGITALATIAAATAIWSVTARIPIIVNVSGIMIPSRGLFKASSPSNGVVVYPFEKIGNNTVFKPPSWSAQAYDYQWGNANSDKAGVDEAISLATAIAGDIAEDDWVRFSSVDIDENPRNIDIPFKSVIAIIDNAESRANLLLTLSEYQNELKDFSLRDKKYTIDLRAGKLLANKRKQILNSAKPISPQAISQTSLLQYEQEYLSEVASIRNIEQEVLISSGKLVDTRNKLVRALQAYLTASLVYAFEDATVNSFTEEQWATVNSGTELMTLTWSNEVSPNTIPLFLDSSTFTQVAVGMDVILTPEGFNPSEVGGIKGKIQSISPLPKDVTSLENTLGVKAAAQSAQQLTGGAVYLAEVKLALQDKFEDSKSSLFLKDSIKTQTDNRGGYLWNNSSNPPLPPRSGLKLSAQVTTRYLSPAAMVFSFMRELTGLETPSQLRKGK